MIKKKLLKPYSLLESQIFKWFFCLTGPILSFIYLLTVKPYGFSLFPLDEQIRLALFYSVPVIGIWALHLFLLQKIVFKKLNFLTTFFWLIWIHFATSMYVYSFSEVYIFDSQFDWYFFPDTLRMVFQFGGVVTFSLILAHLGYLYLFQKKSEFSS